jgi:hypothetical protein
MSSTEILSQFSSNRLDGEPVPDDLKILLPHRDELAERTGIRLEWAEGWAPWLSKGGLTQTDRQNPENIANLRAILEVCRFIACVAEQNGRYFGYWRSPTGRTVANSPLVVFDGEGQFHLCIASTFAEAVLEKSYGHEGFEELRSWLQSVGILIGWENPSQLTFPHEKLPPKELYKELFHRYRLALSPGE